MAWAFFTLLAPLARLCSRRRAVLGAPKLGGHAFNFKISRTNFKFRGPILNFVAHARQRCVAVCAIRDYWRQFVPAKAQRVVSTSRPTSVSS
jgi:hypothetical protein